LGAWIDESADVTGSGAGVAGVAGFQGISKRLQEHAVETMKTIHDESISPSDEKLLEVLAKAVVEKRQHELTPSGLLGGALRDDPVRFAGPDWNETRVGVVLKRYGIRSVKVGRGRRSYRDVTLDQLRRIEQSYGLDMGLKAATSATPATTHAEGGGSK